MSRDAGAAGHAKEDSEAKPALPTSHPFADSTNRPSVLFSPPATAQSPIEQKKETMVTGGDGLGLGKPFEDAARRDITVKPPRRPAPPPSTAPFPADPSLSRSTSVFPLSTSRPSHRPTKSTSSLSSSASFATALSSSISTSSPHAPIPAPVYPVRSQRVSVSHSRNNSITPSGSLSGLAAVLGEDSAAPYSPTISGGLVRRLSTQSLSGLDGTEDDAEEPAETKVVRRRPLAHRSESLPCFPPAEVIETREREEEERTRRREEELATLPPNPKLWLPSHLSLYLSHTLSLPPHLSADITSFIRASRLSGRTFLRLRDADLHELGINVRWRPALAAARDALRREALGGRVLWGFQGGSASPPRADGGAHISRPSLRRRPSVEVEGSASEDEQGKEDWKRSWRTLGSRTPGRVRGLRAAFEKEREGGVERVEEVSEPGSSPVKRPGGGWSAVREGWRGSWYGPSGSGGGGAGHGRTDSTASAGSAASVDSAGGKYVPHSLRLARGRSLPPLPLPLEEALDVPASPFSAGEEEGDLFSPATATGTGSGFSHTHSHGPRYPSQSSSDRGLPFPFSTPEDTPPSTVARPSKLGRLKLDLGDRDDGPASPSPSPSAGTGGTYQAAITAHADARPYAPVRRPSSSPPLALGSMIFPPAPEQSTPSFADEHTRARTLRAEGTLVRGGAKGTGRVSFREFVFPPSSASASPSAAGEDEDDRDGEGDGEPTVRPGRHGSGSAASSEGEGLWSTTQLDPPAHRDPRVGGLRELFGLEVPRTRTCAGEGEGGGEKEGEGELATLFVPERGGEGQRKGSLVLVKKSQLAALHRRLDEVEHLVSSLSLTSPDISLSRSQDGGEGEGEGERRHYQETWRGGPGTLEQGLDEEMGRVESAPLTLSGSDLRSLEHRARTLTSSSLASLPSSSPPLSPPTSPRFSPAPLPNPGSAFAVHVQHTPDTSFSSFFGASAGTEGGGAGRKRKSKARRVREEKGEAEGRGEGGVVWPEGWRQLSGYVVAASIGIGIVAGEVVVAKLFGLRRR
ncbi:hypothetical protein JCM10207_001429 [Rhodosporidiobolus poonsookiae]